METLDLLAAIQKEMDEFRAKRDLMKYSRKNEPIESIRWYTFLQLEKDYQQHIDNLNWTFKFLSENGTY